MSSGEMEGVVSILGRRLDFLKQLSGCFLDFVSFFYRRFVFHLFYQSFVPLKKLIQQLDFLVFR